MSGENAHSLLAPVSLHYAPASLPNATLVDLGRYPMAVRGAGTVLGEVHWLEPGSYAATLQHLDTYEGAHYQRRLRTVLPRDSDIGILAWTYLAVAGVAVGYPQIPSGNWRTTHHRNHRSPHHVTN